MSKIVFIDLETTGVNYWQHGLHQISGYIEIDGAVKEQFNFHVRPHERAKIEIEALNASNVTEEQIMAYPHMSEVYPQLVKLLGKYVNKFDKKDKYFLSGYNVAAFDCNFLRGFFVQNDDKYFGSWFWPNTLDVNVLATQYLINKRTELIDFKLKTVASYLGINVDESKLHDAIYDIYLTREIYYKIIK